MLFIFPSAKIIKISHDFSNGETRSYFKIDNLANAENSLIYKKDQKLTLINDVYIKDNIGSYALNANNIEEFDLHSKDDDFVSVKNLYCYRNLYINSFKIFEVEMIPLLVKIDYTKGPNKYYEYFNLYGSFDLSRFYQLINKYISENNLILYFSKDFKENLPALGKFTSSVPLTSSATQCKITNVSIYLDQCILLDKDYKPIKRKSFEGLRSFFLQYFIIIILLIMSFVAAIAFAIYFIYKKIKKNKNNFSNNSQVLDDEVY